MKKAKLLEMTVGASVAVFLFACGDAMEKPEPNEQSGETKNVGGKGDTFGEDRIDLLDRDGECEEDNKKDDPDCFIRVASWNIQVFGQKKARNDELMDRIADKLSHFDVVAVQEINNIREKSDPGCSRNDECPDSENCGLIRGELEEHLNERLDRNYGFAFSDQVRHERYLYVYDKDRVELIMDRLVDDPGDTEHPCTYRPENTGWMVRQPHLGVFRAGDFSFTLMNAHIVPEKAYSELGALFELQRRVEEAGFSDVIVLGDLNADCTYLSETEQEEFYEEDYTWLFDGVDTTSQESTACTYDQVAITEPTEEDLTGDLGIANELDPEVSDHYPVWANFYTDTDTDQHAAEVLP